MSPIWRNPVSQSDHHNPGYGKHWAVGGHRTLLLDCGHSTARKLSAKIPLRVRCKECESRRDGSVQTLFHEDGSKTVETWDFETAMPKRVQKNTNKGF